MQYKNNARAHVAKRTPKTEKSLHVIFDIFPEAAKKK